MSGVGDAVGSVVGAVTPSTPSPRTVTQTPAAQPAQSRDAQERRGGAQQRRGGIVRGGSVLTSPSGLSPSDDNPRSLLGA